VRSERVPVAAAPAAPAAPSTTDRSARAALVVFAAVLVGAAVLYALAGRRYWFHLDEWSYLAGRDAGDVHSLLEPHNEHWTTLPILAYRALWNVFGLHSYRPYQVPVLALHLAAGVLLRVIMRRAGINPWIATAAATMFVLLGASAWNNIFWGFQLTVVGSLVFGLVHLVLADHDGPVDRRDAVGLGFGLAALLCSGVGITMTAVVGLAVLLRRGWRMAALHVVPLAIVFGAWWLVFARSQYSATGSTPTLIMEFVRHGGANAFRKIGRLPGVGVALGVMLVVGLVMAWARLPATELRRRAAAPAAMLVGSLLFLGVTAAGRAADFGVSFAERSRYVHVIVALVAPALAVAADAIARRWRVLTPVVIVLLLLGVPRNVGDLREQPPPSREFTLAGTTVTGGRSLLLSVAHSPSLAGAPRGLRPFPGPANRDITVGWIQRALHRGRLPDDVTSPDAAATATAVLALHQTGDSDASGQCVPLEVRTRRLEAGDRIDFGGVILVRLIGQDGGRSEFFGFPATRGSTLSVRSGPLTLQVAPYPGREAVECA
jgi:hypothetical protein